MTAAFQKAILLIVFVSGCTSPGIPAPEIVLESGRIPLMEILPDTVLARVSDYLVAPSGSLYLADPAMKHIVILDENRNLRRVVGREGPGPGEFQYPYRLALVRDTLKVWDRLSTRLQNFSRDGDYLSTARPDPIVSGVQAMSLSDDGRMLVSAYGTGAEYLVRIYGGDLSSVSELGSLEAPSNSTYVMGLSKSDAQSRTIPDALKNRAFAVPIGDEGMILVHTNIPVFKKYDASGQELWRMEQDHPDLQAMREEAFERTLQETGNRAHSPKYWSGGVNDGHGGCYLQLRNTDQVVLFHLTAEGALKGPIKGPEGNWGTLRRYAEMLWLLNPDTLELVQLRLHQDEI